MMKLLTLIVLILTFLIVSGCSSVTLNMASNRFISPEGGIMNFETGVQGVNRVTIVPDASASPPTTNAPGYGGTDVGYLVAGGFQIFHPVDFFVSYGLGGVPIYGLKIQLFGPTYKEEKQGDVSLAITGGGGYANPSASSPPDWQYSSEMWAEDASVILGYRKTHFLLFYGGGFYTRYQVKGTITQPVGGSNVYAYSGTGDQEGINAGFELGRWVFIRFEVALVYGRFANAFRSKTDTGLVAGFQF